MDELLSEYLDTDEMSRVKRAYKDLLSGYNDNPDEYISMFESDHQEMVIVKQIEYYSLCKHHVLPFFGYATVGYIPSGKVLGLSKFGRVITCFSRRLQIQEELTKQIADFLTAHLRPKGLGVLTTAQHFCMLMRGVEKQDASMVVSAMRGNFLENDVKSEFIRLSGFGGDR